MSILVNNDSAIGDGMENVLAAVRCLDGRYVDAKGVHTHVIGDAEYITICFPLRTETAYRETLLERVRRTNHRHWKRRNFWRNW